MFVIKKNGKSSPPTCHHCHHKLSIFKLPTHLTMNVHDDVILKRENRKAKFKRALRSHFLTHFTKKFCRFLTPKVKNGTDMINPSIKSSDFLFWHEKIWSRVFENFVGNRQSTCHEFKISVCYTHSKFYNMKFSLSVFDKIFKNPTQNFFYAKIENQTFRLIGWLYLCHF